jgi:hypothetical protein
MNTKDLIRLGVPPGEPTRRGMEFIARYVLKGLDKTKLAAEVEAVVREPAAFAQDELRGEFAKSLLRCERTIREAPAAWRQWGEGLEPEAVNQMGRACQLPVAVAGALMPDAYVGYGLPIGGVLATDNAVIPYAVGVDIACRMKLTVLDLPVRELDRQREQLIKAIETETRFGVGASFQERREHEVLEADWSVSPGDEAEQGSCLGAARHQRERQSLRRVRRLHERAAHRGIAGRRVRGAVEPQRQPGDRGGRVRLLQQAGDGAASGPAQGTQAPRVVVARLGGWAGILGGDGVDGPLCGGQSRAHSSAPGPAFAPERAARRGESPQFRVEGTARD